MKELKRLLPYLRRYKSRIYLGFLFVTISNLASTYLPRVVGKAIDIIQSAKFDMNDIYSILGMLITLTAISGFFMFLTRQTIIVVSRLIEYDLRKDYLDVIETRDNAFYDENSSGTLMAYATNDIPAAREFLGPAIMYTANTITTFVLALFYMLSLNVEITLFALLPLPLIAITTFLIGKKVHESFKDVQENFARLTTHAQEFFSGIRVVLAYVRVAYELSAFEKLSREYMKKNLRLARFQSLMMPLLMVLVGLSQIIVLGYGGYRVIQQNASLGDLTQFFIYIGLLIWPVAAIGWITNLVQRAAASAGRLGKIFDLQKIQDNYNDNLSSDFKIKGAIEFRNVSFNYKTNGKSVLNNISFSLPEGKTLGIVGGIGSGKSTIAHLICRLYEPVSGNILIDNIDYKKIPTDFLRANIGMVTQETFLFSDTIRRNILFGKPNADEDELVNAAKIAHLHSDVLEFPDKYDTMLGERGITLSGGQKQRVSLARAIIKNPPILILDDALSAVDTNTEIKILNSIEQFLKGRTTLIISHRLSSLKNADNIIVLDKGEIIEQGTHDALLALQGKYFDIYSRQQLERRIAEIE